MGTFMWEDKNLNLTMSGKTLTLATTLTTSQLINQGNLSSPTGSFPQNHLTTTRLILTTNPGSHLNHLTTSLDNLIHLTTGLGL